MSAVQWMRKIGASVAAAALALTGLAVTAPQAAADPAQCPALVVLAARGSGEPAASSYLYPRTRATASGWEGGMIQRFLQNVNLDDALVIGLDDNDYEASLVWVGSGTDVYESALNGARSAVKRALQFEDQTGCRPSYMTVGYSQGAAVMHMAELPLSLSGRLIGSVYMGDPFLTPGDPAMVGALHTARGMMFAPAGGLSSTQLRAAERTVNYCNAIDPVCDWPGDVDAAQENFIHHIVYFRPKPQLTSVEQYVVDRTNEITETARQRKADGRYLSYATPQQWRFIAQR